MQNKDTVAFNLAQSHRDADPAITRVVRLLSDSETQTMEPIKLLEVNPDTSPSGVLPIAFGPDSDSGVPFPAIVIEVTESEFEQIEDGQLSLPDGWRIGQTIYPTQQEHR